MPISFSNIPADLKVPLYWVEVDPSMAGLPVLGLPALLVGTMITEGDAAPDVPIAVGSQAQADAHFGQGSELSRCFKAYFANNFANQVFGLPVSEPTGGVAASGTITITTAPTDAGVISLYIGGELVAVPVAASDTVINIADAIASAINAEDDLPVTAVAGTGPSGTVTLTCRWNGASGNDISVMLNYYGPIGGEITPPGLVMTLPATGMLTGGSGVPTFTNAISNLGDQNYEYVSLPYTDSATLMAWETEYGFSDTGRWGWMRQQYGHLFSAKRDTYANLITWGNTRNSGVTSVLGVEPLSPSPVYEWSAAYAAKAQRSLVNDPARPLQTLTLNQIKLAPLSVQGARFDVMERQGLASNGLATQSAGSDNQPMIARETTTYQLNLYGNPDTAYELVTTLATLARLIRNQKQAITSKFPRCKLADDGTRFGPGQAIVTPSVIKAEIIAEYSLDQYNGLTENTQAFVQNLLVERDPNDPNRINVLYPPDLINQLRVFAVLAQFRLQYNALIDPTVGANIGQSGIVIPGMVAA
jgi:phage tail sheath gpL-like